MLLVDVDEVLALFLRGLELFAEPQGFEMRVEKFALFENMYEKGSSEPISHQTGRRLFEDFFRFGESVLPPAPGAREALSDLTDLADIVILSNAPAYARGARARWLATHGFDYPLVLNSGPKGPAAAALARKTLRRTIFIDDIIHNLDSVAETAPHVTRFQMVADPRLRQFAPSAPERHPRFDDWPDMASAIRAALGA